MSLALNQITLYKVNTVNDVETFFRWLIEDQNLSLHPDTPFNDYVFNGDGPSDNRRVYSDEQAKQLDEVMEACFEFCDKKDIDIYMIGLEFLHKYMGI